MADIYTNPVLTWDPTNLNKRIIRIIEKVQCLRTYIYAYLVVQVNKQTEQNKTKKSKRKKKE